MHMSCPKVDSIKSIILHKLFNLLFYLLYIYILYYIYIYRFLEELDEGVFIQQTLETLLVNADGKQLIVCTREQCLFQL